MTDIFHELREKFGPKLEGGNMKRRDYSRVFHIFGKDARFYWGCWIRHFSVVTFILLSVAFLIYAHWDLVVPNKPRGAWTNPAGYTVAVTVDGQTYWGEHAEGLAGLPGWVEVYRGEDTLKATGKVIIIENK